MNYFQQFRMEPIYKISNRQVKKANPQNNCTMQSQYDREQQRIDNKRKQIQQREENMRKLHTGTYLEKREVYDEILQVQKEFQNAREDRIKNDKQQERLLEFQGIAYTFEQEKKRQEKELQQRQQNQKANQKNLILQGESIKEESDLKIPYQHMPNKVQRQRHYKKRNQLILELKKCNHHHYLIKIKIQTKILFLKNHYKNLTQKKYYQNVKQVEHLINQNKIILL